MKNQGPFSTAFYAVFTNDKKGTVTSTLMPGHTENLIKWKELAGNMAVGGLIVADITESLDIKGSRSAPWNTGKPL